MDWAYQHDGSDSSPLPFSENLDLYEAMCRRCHLKLDKVHERVSIESRRANAKKAREAISERRGPSSQKHILHLRKIGKERIETDPEYREKMVEVGRKNGVKTSQMKRECECGMITNPGMLARHMKSKGHKPRWN